MSNFFTKIKKGLLIAGDISILYLALWITLNIRLGSRFDIQIWQKLFFPFTIVYLVWLIIFYIFGLYDLNLAKNTLAFYTVLIKSLVLCGFLATAIFYFAPFLSGITPKTILFLNLIVFFILFSIWRHIYNFLVKFPTFSNKLLIIGENSQSRELVEIINSNPQLGYEVISLINHQKDKLSDLQLNSDIHTVISAVNLHRCPEIARYLYQHLSLFNFESFPDFYEKITGKIPLLQIDEIWFLKNLRQRETKIYEGVKRAVDLLISLILGIVFLLLFPLVALAIKIDSPGPVFYSQKRVGKDGKVFNLIKFRSMKKEAEKGKAIWAQKNDSRITRVGKVLRKTLIDELPQFMNILKGEMSFIGSRPERPEFVDQLEKKIPFYQIRHIVKPGLTGWAQVDFSYGSSVEDALEKLQYELYYIKNRSLLLDLKIILKTVNLVFKGGTQ